MRILTTLVWLATLLTVSTSHAQVVRSDAETSTPEASTPESSQPTLSKIQLAEAWGLSVDEYDRYLMLKVVDSSFSDEFISPLEVLGKYASGPEQRRYARMYNDLYDDNLRRTMSWLIAVKSSSQGESALARYDASPEIQNYLTSISVTRESVARQTSPSTGAAQSVSPPSTQRVRLFIPYDCDVECAARFHTLSFQQTIGQYSGVDVVFAEAGNSDTDLQHIREWATSQKISIADVRSKNVTLNYDSTNYRELRGDSELPIAITWDGQVVR